MISVIKWIMFLVGILIGIVICQYVYRTPPKIEFKISAFDRFLYSIVLFSVIMAVMMLELGVYEWILYACQPQDWRLILLCHLVENGVLVAIAIPFMSILFGKTARKFNFDLAGVYSVNMIRLYYSASIVACCLWLLYTYRTEIVNNTLEAQCIVNRVMVWLLNVIGTWMGLGFHCESRIDEEMRNIKRSKEIINVKEKIDFFKPFFLGFLINCFFLIVQLWDIKWIQNLFAVIYIFVFGMMIAMLGLVLILNYLKCPSNKRSKQKLSLAINKINNIQEDNEVVEYYESLRYYLVKKDGKNIIKIEKGNVEWPKHEERIKQVFGVQEKELTEFNYNTCLDFLKTEREKRRNFIQTAYVECENERIKQLLKEKSE